jgi:RNA polymerase sigma factor (sigma-70 family)
MTKAKQTLITRTGSLTDDLLKKVFSIAYESVRYRKFIDRAKTAEDYALTATIKFWKSGFAHINPNESLSAYVGKMANNAAIDDFRAWKFKKKTKNGYRHLMVPLPEKFDVRDERCLDEINIDSLLSCLPARQKQVIEHSFGVGRALEVIKDNEIAHLLGITRQTVSSDRKKAIETMRNNYKKGTINRMAA